jgi:hypothetical protein
MKPFLDEIETFLGHASTQYSLYLTAPRALDTKRMTSYHKYRRTSTDENPNETSRDNEKGAAPILKNSIVNTINNTTTLTTITSNNMKTHSGSI